MDFDPNGVRGTLYALVVYLPPPLSHFLDDLRRELVPECNPHAHISVLPPRTLTVNAAAALEEARQMVGGFPPFDVELGAIEVFPVTDVIYISVEGGTEQLRQMHRTLNQGVWGFAEPFAYHPHLTLAQEIPPDQVEALRELAARRWQEFRGRRQFRVERTIIVQNTRDGQWVDLAEGPLRAVPVG
jgi:2'-5' RNA ligase